MPGKSTDDPAAREHALQLANALMQRGVPAEDINLYVADNTISRCRLFSDQPPATNLDARYSSSSGWLGGKPCAPKSLVVSTSPRPK